MISYGVSLLSGGLDSTTVTTMAVKEIDQLTAVTFIYGQTHNKEVVQARMIAKKLGIPQTIIDLSFLKDVAWYSALIDPEEFELPETDGAPSQKGGIPNSYVQIRNTIFISIAMAYLESMILHDIELLGKRPEDLISKIYVAPNVVDYSGYPDCRPEFFSSIEETINLGSKLFNDYNIKTELVTPIISLTKRQIIEHGMEINAPIDLTWSCYKGGDVPCSRCDSCLFRAKGFLEAGIADPALKV